MSAYQMSGSQIEKAKKAPLGSGERFKALKDTVAGGYEKKGMSKDKADKIGAAVAAKQGREKLGANRFNELARKGRAKRQKVINRD